MSWQMVMQFGGTFRAAFLVVTAADFVGNDLSNVQRVRWTPATSPNSTLDIGSVSPPPPPPFPLPCSPHWTPTHTQVPLLRLTLSREL